MLRLKELRKAKGVSQQKLADDLGITQRAYSTYENETRQADYSTTIKLAQYFDVTVDYLLGMPPVNSETDNSQKKISVTKDEEDIVIKYRAMKSEFDKFGIGFVPETLFAMFLETCKVTAAAVTKEQEQKLITDNGEE